MFQTADGMPMPTKQFAVRSARRRVVISSFLRCRSSSHHALIPLRRCARRLPYFCLWVFLRRLP